MRISSLMASQGNPPRLLMVPDSQQGHFSPALQLMHLLTKRGMSLTVWVSKERGDQLRSHVSRGAFGTVEVEVVDIFTNRDSSRPRRSSEELLGAIRASGKVDLSKFSAVISDFFNYFIQTLADEWNVPHFLFYPSPIILASVILHGPSLRDEGLHLHNKANKDKFVPLLGLQMFTAGDIPGLVMTRPSCELHQAQGAMIKAAGFIVNSFDAYDKISVDEFRTALQSKQVRSGKCLEGFASNSSAFPGCAKVYNVGPLHLLKGLSCDTGEGELVEKHESLVWLDKQQRASVVFASFGSVKVPSKDTTVAIGEALLETGVPFLWVLLLSDESSKGDFLPARFEEQTRHRGLVVTSWVPQVEILKHPSVGGFLSHCGWNSILESIDGGVPIIACPIGAEQGMNARYVNERARIGVRVKGDMGEFKAQDVAFAITTLMKRSERQEIWLNIQNLRTETYMSLNGGSSYQHFDELLADISRP